MWSSATDACLCDGYSDVKVEGKGFPYSLPSVGPGADPGIQAVSPQVIINHPPGGRLPLLSARPAVTFPAAEHHCPLAGTKLYCLMTEAHRCEQLAQGCYATFCPQVGYEPTTCWPQVQHSTPCATTTYCAQKRLSWSRCSLVGWLFWAQGTVFIWGSRSLHGQRQFWGLFSPVKSIGSLCCYVFSKRDYLLLSNATTVPLSQLSVAIHCPREKSAPPMHCGLMLKFFDYLFLTGLLSSI